MLKIIRNTILVAEFFYLCEVNSFYRNRLLVTLHKRKVEGKFVYSKNILFIFYENFKNQLRISCSSFIAKPVFLNEHVLIFYEFYKEVLNVLCFFNILSGVSCNITSTSLPHIHIVVFYMPY